MALRSLILKFCDNFLSQIRSKLITAIKLAFLFCEETVGVVVNNSWWKVLRRFVLSALVLSLAATSLPPMAIAATTVAATTVAAKPSGISEASPPATIQALRRKLDQYQPQVKILSPQPNQVLPETRVSLEFQVKDLPLYKDATLGLGPHLHVFLDEDNYQAVYDTATPLVLTDLKPGTHTVRVFASRPWHESFKNDGAFAQVTFSVLTPTQDDRPNPDLPLLTYSRPQGSYGAEPVMLDYYLTNAPLHIVAQDDKDVKDWRVKATIDGTSFILDRWQPIYLKGLKPGQNWAQLEFIDDKGNSIPNVFNNTVKLFDYQPGGTDTLSKLVRGELSVEEAMPIVDQTYKPKPKPAVIPAVPAAKVTAPEAKKPEAKKPEAKKPEANPAPEKVRALPIVPIPVPVIKPPSKSIVPKAIEEVKPVPKPIEVKKPAPKPVEVKPAPKPVEVKKVAPKPIEVKPVPMNQVLPKPSAPVQPPIVPAKPIAPQSESPNWLDRFKSSTNAPKPIEAKPIEAKPIEAKPIEAKPIEAKPIVTPKTIEAKKLIKKPIEVKAVAPIKAKPVEVKPIAPVKVVTPAKTTTPAEPSAPIVEAKTDRFDYLKSYLDKPIQAKPIPAKLPEIKPEEIKPVPQTVKKIETIVDKTKQTAKKSVEAVKQKRSDKAPIEKDPVKKAPVEKASTNNLELPKNVRRIFDRLPMPSSDKPEELVPIGKLTK
jgi:hypothetical protein